MILAVAMITAAAGAIAEFQIRMTYICTPADGAFMGVGGFRLRGGCFVGACGGEGDNFGTILLGCVILLLSEKAPRIGPPGHGDHIQYIFAEEQEVVGKGDDGEAVIGEGIDQQAVEYQNQIDQREDPCFDRNDEKQQELGIGIHGGIAEEQTQIQVVNICPSAEDHTPDIHHHDTAKIEQVEPQCSPDILNGATKGVITEQEHGHQQDIAVEKGEGIGKQAPDLSLKDRVTIKNQQGIEQRVLRDLGHQIDQRTAQTDVKHQIRDALVAVLETETVEPSA